ARHRVRVGEYDVVLTSRGLALEGLEEVGARVPPRLPLGIVVVAPRVPGPDAAAGRPRFALGRHERVVEAPRIAVLGEVRAHAGPDALDVEVLPAAVLVDEDVGEVAAVSIAHLPGVVAFEPDDLDAGEVGL